MTEALNSGAPVNEIDSYRRKKVVLGAPGIVMASPGDNSAPMAPRGACLPAQVVLVLGVDRIENPADDWALGNEEW